MSRAPAPAKPIPSWIAEALADLAKRYGASLGWEEEMIVFKTGKQLSDEKIVIAGPKNESGASPLHILLQVGEVADLEIVVVGPHVVELNCTIGGGISFVGVDEDRGRAPTLLIHAEQLTGFWVDETFHKVVFAKNTWCHNGGLSGFITNLECSDCVFNDVRFEVALYSIEARRTAFEECEWTPSVLKAELTDATFPGSNVQLGAWIESVVGDPDFQTAKKISDPWMELREDFTGLRLYKNLTLTLVFFSPIIIKAALLAAFGAVIGHEPVPLAPLWYVLLYGGYTNYWAGVHAIFTGLLLVFNALRMLVTFDVVKLADREDYLRTAGFTKARPKLAMSKKLSWRWEKGMYPHRLLVQAAWVSRLYWVSLIYALINLIPVLFHEVPRVAELQFHG